MSCLMSLPVPSRALGSCTGLQSWVSPEPQFHSLHWLQHAPMTLAGAVALTCCPIAGLPEESRAGVVWDTGRDGPEPLPRVSVPPPHPHPR